MPRQHTNRGKAEEAAGRRIQALELRKAGVSYRAIGDRLGVSEAQAHRDVKAAMQALQKVQDTVAEDVRTMELARLDDMYFSIATQIRNGNHGAIDRGLRIMERRAKLLGLDAATRNITIDITDATDEQLDRIAKGEDPTKVMSHV